MRTETDQERDERIFRMINNVKRSNFSIDGIRMVITKGEKIAYSDSKRSFRELKLRVKRTRLQNKM